MKNKELLKKCWNDAQHYDAMSGKKTFEKWYSDNTMPEEIKNALDYCSGCDKDFGFMGSPEYYKQKELINCYFNKA
jgi:hypothetical protein